MANDTLGASFSIDTTDLKAGLAQANRMIRESESEFKAAAAGMDDWAASEEGLNAKIKSLNSITEVQRAKVDALQSEYDRLIADGLDPSSKAAVDLRTKINNETAALNKNEAELKKQTQALQDLEDGAEDAGDATDDMGDSFSGLKAAGGVAAGAIAAVGAACVAAVGAFLGLAESTREARNNMAKVETSFQSAGLSAENAANTMTELYGIMGDEGAASEAAQQLAKISKNEKDLEANTRILTGVMAEYGASIPTEGLAEGMAATAAMGEVQGPLADALEWQGVNLDDVNAKLATLATEEERAAYIQETLTGLYGESADAYRENNAEVIAAQEAQANLNNAMNELGAIAEPIMTTIKTLAAELLTTITPFVSLLGEGLTGALNGAAGAADQMAAGLSGIFTSLLSKVTEILPVILETIIAIVPQLLTALVGQLPTILQTLLQMITQVALALAEMLPTLIPTVIDALIMIVETLIGNIDMIIDAGIQLLLGLADGLIEALPRLIEKIPVIIEKLITAFANNYPKMIEAGIKLIIGLAGGLVRAIPQLIAALPQIISAVVNGLGVLVDNMQELGGNIARGLWEGIKKMGGWLKTKITEWAQGILDNLKSFFGINSPAKLIEDEVGENIGLAIGTGTVKALPQVNKIISKGLEDDFDIPIGGSPRAGGAGIGRSVTVHQTNYYSQAHSRYELYKSKQQTAAAVRLAMAGV